MVREYIVITLEEGNVGLVKKEDYLKVVESDKSKEELNIVYYNRIKELEKELKDKEDFIEKQTEINVDLAFQNKEIKEKLKGKEFITNEMNRLTKYIVERFNGYGGLKTVDVVKDIIKNIQQNNEVLLDLIEKKNKDIESLKRDIKTFVDVKEQKDKEIERLKNLYEPEKQYEDWCLLYYEFEMECGKVKHVTQDLHLEEAHNLIGMDCDNWKYYSIKKYKKEVE